MTDKLLTETTYYRTERRIINTLSAIVWHVVTFPRRLVRLVRLLMMRVPKAIIKAELRLMVGKRTYSGPAKGTPITEDNLRSFGFELYTWSDTCREWWMSLSEEEHFDRRVYVRFDESEHRVALYLFGMDYLIRQARCIEDIDLLVDLLHEQSLEERLNSRSSP
jgi:hypothetical protein